MLIDWKKIGKRIDPSDFFKEKKKIVIEIGFGKGDFLLNYSKIFDDNLIGIEISNYSINNFINKYKFVENIRIIHSEAFFALGHLFKENTVDKIFIIFPDPWSKKKQEKKRFLKKEFFDRASFVLKNEGEIFIITDEKTLSKYIEENVTKNFLKKEPPEIYIELSKNTKYGKKWLDLKKDFFPFYFIKKEGIKKYWEDILTGKKFDHLLLKNFDFHSFKEMVKKINKKDKDKFINFKKIYEAKDEFILEFILKEETILQNIFFKGKILKNKCILKILNKEDVIFTRGFFEILENLSLNLKTYEI
jgi:tRNA (guanine-N7-)-methyltransferase